jgi:serine phosphatase RsbU (regulator of sigma subunit)
VSAQSFLDSIQYQIDHADSDTSKLRLLIEYSDYCEVTDIPKYTALAIELTDSLLESSGYDSNFLLYHRGMANNNNGFYYHFIGDHRKSIHYYNTSLNEFTQVPDSNYMALVYNNLAMVYNDLGDVDTTKTLLDKAERICLKHNYIETLIPTYSNIATFHNRYGDYAKSIDYSTKLLKIHKNRDDVDGIVHTYNNLSSIYYAQGDYLKAEEYILKALSFEEQLESTESQATYFYNLSTIQDKLHKDSLAFVNAQKSLAVSKKIDNLKGIGDSYKLMGTYYFTMKELDKAIAYNDSSFTIYEKLEYLEGLSSLSKNKASVFLEMGQLKEAKESGELALYYANQLGYPSDIKHTSFVLTKIYKTSGNYKKAFEMLELYNLMSDSIAHEDKINETYKLQIDLEYNQKTFKDSLKNANEKEVADLKLSEKNAQLEKEQTQNTALIVGLLLLLGSVGFIIRAYNKKKELARTIALQKEVVEQKNKEITDSINYASKIQQAILTSKDYLDSVLDQYFIFYKPKDIVSGDFYWAHQTENNKLIVAVVDCTGHGVPGAFMSMIGNSLLNKIIIENKNEQADDILNRLRLGVIKALSQSGKEHEQRDGMDISLFVWDKTNNTIEYAGANNPLWIVTKTPNENHISADKKNLYPHNDLTLIELKPNKFPIGIYIGDVKPFDSIKYQLTKGDMVYMATDGFADQFGGEKNKKYKYKTLKKFILSINTSSMDGQREKLEAEFEDWMGDNEQLDDVCNFGFKIN